MTEEDDCKCDDEEDKRLPDPIPVAVPQPETQDAPSAWEIPLWGVVTVVAAVATVALALVPFEGPAGDIAAGAGTAASAGRLAGRF